MKEPTRWWRRSSARYGWLALLLLPLGGCISTLLPQPDEHALHAYLLEWRDPGPQRPPDPRGPTLLVSPVYASPGYGRSDMAYMRTPHELEYYANHRWVDAPARMLEPLLLKAAGQSGLFSGVVEAGSGARVDLRLDSRLLHLRRVSGQAPDEQQLALRFTLVEVASARIIASQVIEARETVSAADPYAGVEAANRAVTRLMGELQSFLKSSLKKNK